VSERVERLTAGGKTLVVLDLAGLDGIDAMGIGEIAGAYRRARSHGADLKLINPRPRVDRLLSVTKLRTMIDVWDLPEVEPRPPAYHPAAPGALRV
jgi:anti-anti-sigma factor